MLRPPSRRGLLPALVVSAVAFVVAFTCTPEAQTPVRTLLVVAHPDDELVAAATIYRLAQERGEIVDQFVITNGEGGYRYSTLAEKVYGANLTKEEVGRSLLPDIRKRELLAAGRILGVRAHYFLDEPDRENTADPNAVLGGIWDVPRILGALEARIRHEHYDYLMTALPRADIGGHHLAAVQLALRAVEALDPNEAPVVLGGYFTPEPFEAPAGSPYGGFSGAPDYDFDRERAFGFNNALDYQIVANWVIAEHKSQGLYQKNVNSFAHEYMWVYERDTGGHLDRAKALFALLDP